MTKEIVSEALYRKYRPKNFEEVLGQEEVVSALQNSIKKRNIAHAYLFSGGRGSGKTTTARIFANELKIKQSDIYEIDAASNRGIDQIRELRDAVNILPLESDYKIYIIDEVHMLTKEAFNALLKTLEEPPKHVIFILATTEKYKVLDTIVSRCQSFEFKKANTDILLKLIKDIAKKEKVKINDEIALDIALKGGGSFRDTLSELQRKIALFGSELKSENKTGDNERELISNFVDSLDNKEKVYSVYKKVLESGIDGEVFLEKVLERVRKILLIKNSQEMADYFKNEFSPEEIVSFQKNNFLNAKYLIKLLEALDLSKKSLKSEIAIEIFINELFE